VPRGPGTLAAELTSKKHGDVCDHACPDCIRSYRNMSFHGLLDWRLGLSMLRVMANPEYRCGLDGAFSAPELTGWVEKTRKTRDAFCVAFHVEPHDFGSLPGAVVGDRPLIFIHPLWNPNDRHGLLEEAGAALPADVSPRYRDTFNLHRRMSWTYLTLGSDD
jgi:DEAD/DEAH box helicase domain-containing protein